VGTRESASVRVNVFARNGDLSDPLHPVLPSVMVTVSDPHPSAPGPPWLLRTTIYERDVAEHKHVATMGLIHQQRLARAKGYDDVLFVDRQGLVAEGSIWNIALWDGQTVTFPSAAVLPGITMSLIGEGLRRIGVPVAMRPLLLEDLGSMRSAVAMYSVCFRQPIGSVNGAALPVTIGSTSCCSRPGLPCLQTARSGATNGMALLGCASHLPTRVTSCGAGWDD
jgi:branched-subunit amino acid aminotransferase/4-amino-4-deoxychorismate lyase